MQYTTAQVLSIVGISRRTLQNWISDGRLAKYKQQGKKRTWDAVDVKRLIEIKFNEHVQPGGAD